jgi:hypothetical protein
MIMLALSGSARSNRALNAGYFCFQALLQSYDSTIQKKSPLVSSTFVLVLNITIFGVKSLNDVSYCMNCLLVTYNTVTFLSNQVPFYFSS